MKFNLLRKKRKGVSIVLLMFSILITIGLAELIVDMGILLNLRYELQKAVDTAAQMTIADFEPQMTTMALNDWIYYPSTVNITAAATSNFNILVNAFMMTNKNIISGAAAAPTITFDNTTRHSKAIKIETEVTANTYFLKVIGITKVKIKASSCAVNVPKYLTGSSFVGMEQRIRNSVGSRGDDTAFPAPLNQSVSCSTIENGNNYCLPGIYNLNASLNGLIGPPDADVTSIGPGGAITMRLPSTLVDGPGVDLQILQRGNATGYFVFAGNDTDPVNPYIDTANPGGGITWVNISCTGIPINWRSSTTRMENAIQQVVNGVSHIKFYGSGYFDLNSQCTDAMAATIYDGSDPTNFTAVKTAKYLRIIDDNVEDGFYLRDPELYDNVRTPPSFFAGQNSSFTPGSSFDSIAVLHQTRMITSSEFSSVNANGVINKVMALYNGHMTDYRKFWGCTSVGPIATTNFTNCASILDDGNGGYLLKMGYSTPNMAAGENPPLIRVNY